MHYTYDHVIRRAKTKDSPDGYWYALVILSGDDTCDNPASTKRKLTGPAELLWEIHASGIDVRYPLVANLPEEIKDRVVLV